MAKKSEFTNKGYVGKDIPLYEHDMSRETDVTIDLYLKDGMPCGDVGASGGNFYANTGEGNIVGGDTGFGIHHAFENGVPNAGREDISAELMRPVHKENVDRKVLSNIGDGSDEHEAHASKITPEPMGVHHTFGAK